MNEERGVIFCRRIPNRVERFVVEVAAIRAVTIFVGINVGADFGATQPQLAHAAFELGRGELRVLQRKRAQTGVTGRIFPRHFGDVII